MNIALMSDESLVIPTAVALQSFCEHNEGNHEIYFLTTGIKEEDRDKLSSICKTFNSTFHYTCMDEKELDPFDGIGRWSKYTFMKTFIPSLLPSHVDKVLYLDVDLLVTGSLMDIYNLNIERAGLAAVEDVPYTEMNKERCNLSPESVYVNSGVMLMNLPVWRDEMKKTSFLNYVLQNRSKRKINDQDAINSVFENRIIPLDWKYNVTAEFFRLKSEIYKRHRKQFQQARKEAVIIHFTYRKPWHAGSFHMYKEAWYEVLRRTPYANAIKPHDTTWGGSA